MAFKANPEKHKGVDSREQISAELNEQDHPSAKNLPQRSGKPSPSLSSSKAERGPRQRLLAKQCYLAFLLSLTLMSITVSFASETGGICISPRPSNPGAEILPGMAMRPFFGITPSLLDNKVHL